MVFPTKVPTITGAGGSVFVKQSSAGNGVISDPSDDDSGEELMEIDSDDENDSSLDSISTP
jgi:hypothetical protein